MPKRRKKKNGKVGEIFVKQSTGEKTALQSDDIVYVDLHRKFFHISSSSFHISFHRPAPRRLLLDGVLLLDNHDRWLIRGDLNTAHDVIIVIAKMHGFIPQIVKKDKNCIVYKFV